MIVLANTTDKLQLLTGSACSVSVHASYMDLNGSVVTPGRKNTNITTQTTTDIVDVPGASTYRNVKFISVTNKHATNSVYVELIYDANATDGEMFNGTLLAGQTLVCAEGVVEIIGNPPSLIVEAARNDFRLTGVSGSPVMTADSTLLSTIYMTPYRGQTIALYTGSAWNYYQTGEISLALSGRTTDLPFDVFAYDNGGVVSLEFENWLSATVRATDLSRFDGVLVKSTLFSRRYLGTCRPRSATTFHWVTAGVDLPCKFDLWNVDNRVEFPFKLIASTNTWTYTLATWRQAQGSGNYQVDFVNGLQEESIAALLRTTSRNSSISVPRQCGIGYDDTTAFSGINTATANTVASIEASQQADLNMQPGIGRHFLAWLEISTASGTCTWVGDDGALRLQSGMTGNWRA